MSRRVVATVVVLFVVAGAGVLYAADLAPGGAPIPDGSDTTTDSVETTTSTPTTEQTATTTPTTTSVTNDAGSEYRFTIDDIEECGDTCRDVTVTLANTDDEMRRDVRVTTKVYAADDLLWSGDETVGTLEPGESHTSTRRVKLGFSGALKIKSNDGYVTIVTVVHSASGTTRFEDRRKVA